MTTARDASASPLPEFDPGRIVELDLRDLLRSGGEPLPQILAAVDALPNEFVLHLRSTFRPEPLLRLLQQRGFQHHAAMFGEADWSTWFWRTVPPREPTRAQTGNAIATEGADDYRLFHPPEPLLRILARIDTEREAFEVLLPFFPEPLVALLRDEEWTLTLVGEASDGVRVRLVPPEP